MKISLVKCPDYQPENLNMAIGSAVRLLGGLQEFVKPGERILIKPNILGSHSPEECVTTHPEFVRAVVRMVKDAGAIPVIGDGPSVLNGMEIFQKTGMAEIARQENVELVNLNDSPGRDFQSKRSKLKKIYITKYLDGIDGIISLPKFKTHSLTTITLAVKNLYGLVPGLLKTEYHKIAHSTALFSKILLDIFDIIRPKLRLSIIDGIQGMDGEGPANGRLRNFNFILAGDDAFALDIVGCELMGIDPKTIFTLRESKIMLKDIEIKGGAIGEFKIKDPAIPKTHIANYIPESLAGVLAKFVWSKPEIMVRECKLCMKCFDICPVKSIKKVQDAPRDTPQDSTGKIHLKVDWQNCISCFCCNEVCPHHSIEIRQSSLFRLAKKIAGIRI
ncbi:MAG: DUF362 domain-containing protein [Elusimicrobiota bacterium]